MKKEIVNATIDSTMLGYEGHGILTAFIYLDFGGSHQGFGGYSLGGEYTNKWIKGILETIGVEKWEDLNGKHVRVERMEGWNGKITRIGNIIEDKWFDPTK